MPPCLQPGDTILGMNLAHGGHLTHGHPLNFSGKTYKIVPYGVRKEDEHIDYDELERLADEHKPKMIIAGASAYPRILDFARFRQIADSVGAVFVVDMAHISGLVAAGVHPNPCEYADIVTSTTHKTLRGPRAGLILASEKYGTAIDKTVFPGTQGGRWSRHGRQGGLLPGSHAARIRRLSETGGRQCPGAGREPDRCRLPRGFRRHRYPPSAGRCLLQRRSRQGSRAGPRPRPHHRQQERHPLRHEPAVEPERHPPGLPGRHHARIPASPRCARSARSSPKC